MYHLLGNSLSKTHRFIVVNDISYSSSGWHNRIPTSEDFESSTSHWNRNNSTGKPIIEVIDNKLILASSPNLDFHTNYTPSDFPELLL